MANADTSDLDERDLLRIMISTDNHLGVNEDDAVRGDDSFRAFEEVLRKAVENRCDLVLLGGDLFHDNQPSRSTMHKTVRILKKYCMSDRPVSFQILSNQAENFPSTGVVNYEDPNYNVGLPIFTIHGNHDDPTGVGRLSAVDILAQCALVNYFGNVELEGSGIGKLRISPVLLQKGATHLALYGLGNIREERLGRLFKTPGNVEWERPEEAAADWFSMFVLHQNREKRGPKNFLDEAVLPEFLDLVLWGHEHQCIPTPQDAMAKNEDGEAAFEILQAGSTVPTSLSEGEADPKHCFILEMMGAQYRVLQTPLETVRPFMYGQVCLRTAANLDPDDVKGTESFLEEQVSKMIHQATSSSGSNMLPLIRLKVDYTGFSTINVQRFGQRFVKKVANPQDILIFSKQAQRRQQQQEQREDDMERLRPEQLDQARIEDLIAEHIGPGEPLEVLLEEELKVALHHFVDKDERQALEACVKGVLQRLQADMEAGTQGAEGIKAGAMEEMIRSRASEISSQARAGVDSAGDRAAAPVAASSPAPVLQRPSATLPSPSPAATSEQQARVDAFFKPMPRARSSGRAASSIGSAQPDRAKGAHSRRGAGGAAADDEDPVKLTQTSRARPAREAAKRGGAARRRQVVSDEDDSDEIAGSDGSGDDSDGIVDDDGDGDSWMRDSEEDAPPSSHRSRGRNGKAKAKAAVTPSSRNKRTRSDAWGGAVDAENPQGSAKRPGTAGIWPPRARSKQTPGTRATPSARAEVDEDVILIDSDDEDEEELGGPKVSRRLPASISQRMPTPSKRAGWGSMT